MSQIFRGLALDYGAIPNTSTLIGGFTALVVLTIISLVLSWLFLRETEAINFRVAAGTALVVVAVILFIALD